MEIVLPRSELVILILFYAIDELAGFLHDYLSLGLYAACTCVVVCQDVSPEWDIFIMGWYILCDALVNNCKLFLTLFWQSCC